MSKVPIITIDGLSGAGKGTVSKMLCTELGWNILDSGALYRTLTFLIEKKEIDIDDFIYKKEEFLRDFMVSFQVGSIGEPVSVFLKEEDITNLVRTEKIAEKTSAFSSLKVIRDFIRSLAKSQFYRTHYYENVNQQRFIELTFKHLLGRPPQSQEEIIKHNKKYKEIRRRRRNKNKYEEIRGNKQT